MKGTSEWISGNFLTVSAIVSGLLDRVRSGLQKMRFKVCTSTWKCFNRWYFCWSESHFIEWNEMTWRMPRIVTFEFLYTYVCTFLGNSLSLQLFDHVFSMARTYLKRFTLRTLKLTTIRSTLLPTLFYLSPAMKPSKVSSSFGQYVEWAREFFSRVVVGRTIYFLFSMKVILYYFPRDRTISYVGIIILFSHGTKSYAIYSYIFYRPCSQPTIFDHI